MKSKPAQVRLTEDEWEMVRKILSSDDRGTLSVSEVFRLLLHREFKRRTTGRSAVAGHEISSDFRTGRPRKEK